MASFEKQQRIVLKVHLAENSELSVVDSQCPGGRGRKIEQASLCYTEDIVSKQLFSPPKMNIQKLKQRTGATNVAQLVGCLPVMYEGLDSTLSTT